VARTSIASAGETAAGLGDILAGPGAPSFLASGGGAIDTCALLTKAQIQEVLGKPVKDGKRNAVANPAVGSPCEYVVGDYGVFSLLVKPVGPGETPDRMMDALKKNKIKSADMPGLGDRSFFTFPGYGMVQLNTYYKTSYVLITLFVPGLSEDDQKAPAEKLMKLVLPKL